MTNLITIMFWGIGMGWGIALILAILVVIVGIYSKIKKR